MTREEKRQARIDYYKERATQATGRSNAAYERSNSAVSDIPFGQSILVGHHSERGHRSALARSHASMDKMVEESRKAEYYQHKAEAAENNHAIYTEDENAIERLEEKITNLTKIQEQMKAANKIVRSKKLTDIEKIDRLVLELEIKKESAQTIVPNGFSDYSLTNNNAVIRNAKKRLEQIKILREKQDKEYEVNGVKVIENYTENRFQIFFGYKPEEEVRKNLKNAGYRWSPSNECWQCYMKRWAMEQGKSILEAI